MATEIKVCNQNRRSSSRVAGASFLELKHCIAKILFVAQCLVLRMREDGEL
jgi:hypothetical protein